MENKDTLDSTGMKIFLGLLLFFSPFMLWALGGMFFDELMGLGLISYIWPLIVLLLFMVAGLIYNGLLAVPYYLKSIFTVAADHNNQEKRLQRKPLFNVLQIEEQSAVIQYYFGQGYMDVLTVIDDVWAQCYNRLGRKIKIKDCNKINTWNFIFLSPRITPMIICNSIFSMILLIIGVLINTLLIIPFYVLLGIVWSIDRFYLWKKSIFTVCPHCKGKSLIPAYRCSKCGEIHKNLVPSIYGILQRECRCGEKLPASFMNGRNKLKAVCPHCKQALVNRESRPLCFPVIGGRNAGKTAFISAMVHQFVYETAPANQLRIMPYSLNDQSIEKDMIFSEMEQLYHKGKSSTVLEHGSTLSFFVHHSGLNTERLFHIYDVSGEQFIRNSEEEIQQQYAYCHGLIFVINPFTIPKVYNQYRNCMQDENREDDEDSLDNTLDNILDVFMHKLRQVTGMDDKDLVEVPLALVLTRIDTGDLRQKLGREAVQALMTEQPEVFKDYYDTQDYLCRRFLHENEMDNFINHINFQFKNNRYFACQVGGHRAGVRDSEPEGVMDIMAWLLHNADEEFAELCHVPKFSKSLLVARGRSEELQQDGGRIYG